LSSFAKVLGAITAAMVALTSLWVTIRGDDGPPPAGGVVIVLDSPAAYARFLENHPGG
jgi:hypothetical protein